MRKGNGKNPNKYPWPKNLKELLIFFIGNAFVIKNDIPLSMVCIAKVEIRGGILRTDVVTPLMVPNNRPIIIVTKTAMTNGTLRSTENFAANTPARASIDPTDMSMPPPIITMDIPMDEMAIKDICLPTLSKLSVVKNILCIKENKTISKARTNRIPNL
jgi:hypothetical protein